MSAELTGDNLLTRAISGVLTGAQEGELPLFAWTLGMQPESFLHMIEQCFPELGELNVGDPLQFEQLLSTVPQLFDELVHLMLDSRTGGSPHHMASEWLARAVAAACFGNHHLWEDLGLFDRDNVSTLLTEHFPALAQRNVNQMRWKRFLFHELGVHQSGTPLTPPGCAQCEDYRLCFGPHQTLHHQFHE